MSRSPSARLRPPVDPMRAAPIAELPEPGGQRGHPPVIFEPKWDGFRCCAWVLPHRVILQSRPGRDLSRYFPDLVACLSRLPVGTVLDGELIVWDEQTGRTRFTALQRRITAGRGLAAEVAAHPAHLVAFDLLAVGEEILLDRPLAERRAQLEQLLADGPAQVPVCPQTTDVEEALTWMREWAAVGVEGVVVKPLSSRYVPGRAGWQKCKIHVTTEAIVGGVTGSLAAPQSLLLGRLDERGRLHYVARTVRLTVDQQQELAGLLQPVTGRPGWPVPLPAGWTGLPGSGTPVHYLPVDPHVVAEVRADVAYEHGRARHLMRHLRCRLDLRPDDLPLWDREVLAA